MITTEVTLTEKEFDNLAYDYIQNRLQVLALMDTNSDLNNKIIELDKLIKDKNYKFDVYQELAKELGMFDTGNNVWVKCGYIPKGDVKKYRLTPLGFELIKDTKEELIRDAKAAHFDFRSFVESARDKYDKFNGNKPLKYFKDKWYVREDFFVEKFNLNRGKINCNIMFERGNCFNSEEDANIAALTLIRILK